MGLALALADAYHYGRDEDLVSSEHLCIKDSPLNYLHYGRTTIILVVPRAVALTSHEVVVLAPSNDSHSYQTIMMCSLLEYRSFGASRLLTWLDISTRSTKSLPSRLLTSM